MSLYISIPTNKTKDFLSYLKRIGLSEAYRVYKTEPKRTTFMRIA